MQNLTDIQLIEELKKYGETVTLKQIEKSRDIWIKKLNHHKARQKVETNPSKHAKQVNLPSQVRLNKSTNRQSFASSNINYKNYDDDNDYDDNTENYETVNTNHNDTSGDYIQVNHAHTSPLSNSMQNIISNQQNRNNNNNNYNLRAQQPDLYVLEGDSTPPKTPASDLLNYKRLKDKIELEKTVQKYRDDFSEILDPNKIRPRITSNNTINASSFITDQSKYIPNKDNYRQQFTSTLLEPPNYKQYDSNLNIKKEETEFKVNPRRPRLIVNNNDDKKENMNNVDLKNQSTRNWSLKFSKWLPYIIGLVFLIFGLFYANVKLNAGNKKLVEFFSSSKPNVQDMYCEDITECKSTKQLIRELIDYLRIKTGNAECKQLADNSKYAHYDEIIQYFKKKNLIKVYDENTDSNKIAMNSVIKAISKHPHWGIKLFDSSYNEITNIQDVLYFLSEISSKSFTCRVSESIQTISINIMIILLTLLIGFAIIMIGKLFFKQQQQSKSAFFELINQVVEIVENQYQSSLSNDKIKPYIALSHVYATLIDHSQRKTHKSLWDKVVKYISDHEGRIREESQLIDGEETLVWRWIAPISSQTSSPTITSNISPKQTSIFSSKLNEQSKIVTTNINSESKGISTPSWQSEAFTKQDRLLLGPTPCLKIRNMFDQDTIQNDPFFLINIHNDILSKCAHIQNAIYHISCDKKSKEGCVYVKCSSNDAAGLVYQALNGVYYKDKLLSVKFLQQNRYLERFPESANCNTPLKPIRI